MVPGLDGFFVLADRAGAAMEKTRAKKMILNKFTNKTRKDGLLTLQPLYQLLPKGSRGFSEPKKL